MTVNIHYQIILFVIDVACACSVGFTWSSLALKAHFPPNLLDYSYISSNYKNLFLKIFARLHNYSIDTRKNEKKKQRLHGGVH